MTKSKPLISVIVATDEKRGIGKQGKIPWHIKEDLLFFRNKTQGHAVVMGQTSYDFMMDYYRQSGNIIPERTHIVLTKDPDYQTGVEGDTVVHSTDEALKKAHRVEKEEIFIAGGGQIYAQMLRQADRLYLTLIKGDFQADTFFPEYSEFSKIVSRRKSHDDNYEYTFLVLERRKKD